MGRQAALWSGGADDNDHGGPPGASPSHRAVTDLTLDVVTDDAGFADLRGVWADLSAADPDPNVFLAWPWVSTWWQHFGADRNDRELHVVVVREGETVLGLAPLFRSRVGAGPLGVENPTVRFDLPIRPADEKYADRVLAGLSLRRGEFAILNSGAGWPSKLWPAERFGELAIHLNQRHGLPSIALWGVDQELPDAQIIASTSRGHAHLAPPTTIGQLVALTRRARLFVGSDTGPLHIAVAVGTPSISLHGTSKASWCGAYGPRNLALQAYYADGTSRQRRAMDNAAMLAITVDMVREACDRVLALKTMAKAS